MVVALRGKEVLCSVHVALDHPIDGTDGVDAGSAGTASPDASAESPATAPLDGAGCRDAAAHLMAVLEQHGVTTLHVFGFEDAPGDAHDLLTAVQEQARGRVRLATLAVIRGNRRWLPLSADVRERVDGVDIEPHPDSPAVVAGLVSGSAPLPDRAHVRARIAEDPSVSAGVSALLEAPVTAAPTGESRARVPRHGALWRQFLVAGLSHPGRHDARADLSPEEHLLLLRSLADVPWRDALIAWAAPGSLPVKALPSGVRRALHRHLGQPPLDPKLVLSRLEALARSAPSRHPALVAPVCAAVGCVAWHLGEGGLARDAHERALAADPSYRLAQLGLRVIALGVRPGRPERGQGLGATGRLAV